MRQHHGFAARSAGRRGKVPPKLFRVWQPFQQRHRSHRRDDLRLGQRVSLAPDDQSGAWLPKPKIAWSCGQCGGGVGASFN
jgi:hypothetical protein